jgi:hypothetical protein
MYNSYYALPTIPYNILKHLALSDEIIWKLLKYNDYNALDKPDLTFSEKMELVWKNGPQEQYNIFFTNLIEDAIAESKCLIKIYNYYIEPESLYVGNVVYAFDILYGGKMSLVEYNGIPVSRGDLIVNRLLSILNGTEVNGVGKMVFHQDMSRYDLSRSVIGNSRTYTGKQLFISVLVGDAGIETECDS